MAGRAQDRDKPAARRPWSGVTAGAVDRRPTARVVMVGRSVQALGLGVAIAPKPVTGGTD
jgi:hypothetical protein